MKVRPSGFQKSNFHIAGNQIFGNIWHFKYLNTNATATNDLNVETKYRLLINKNCYYSIKKLFKSHLLTICAKLMLYQALLNQILLHVSKCWTHTREQENMCNSSDRKIFRRIFGPLKMADQL